MTTWKSVILALQESLTIKPDQDWQTMLRLDGIVHPNFYSVITTEKK